MHAHIGELISSNNFRRDICKTLKNKITLQYYATYLETR